MADNNETNQSAMPLDDHTSTQPALPNTTSPDNRERETEAARKEFGTSANADPSDFASGTPLAGAGATSQSPRSRPPNPALMLPLRTLGATGSGDDGGNAASPRSAPPPGSTPVRSAQSASTGTDLGVQLYSLDSGQSDLIRKRSTARMSAHQRRGSAPAPGQGSHFSTPVQMPKNAPAVNVRFTDFPPATPKQPASNAGTPTPAQDDADEDTFEETDAASRPDVQTRSVPASSPMGADEALSPMSPMSPMSVTPSPDDAEAGDPLLISDATTPMSPSATTGKLKKQITKVVAITKLSPPVLASRRRKRVKNGQVVFKGHKSWEIVLSIQFGLQYTSDLLQSSDASEPTEQDFRESLAFDFNPIDDQRTTSVFDVNKYAKWVHPAPFVYRCIRAKFGVSEQEFLDATCSESRVRELPTPGKSGALFYITDDENYFMKTITNEEEKMLVAMLPSYYAHISTNPDTLLTRYLAHFSVETTRNRHIRMVVMSSVFTDSIFIDKKYDLKGSTHKRFAKPEELQSENVTLKDQDLGEPIYFNPDVVEHLHDMLAKDTAFLESHHVMDYSLLLGMSEMIPEEDHLYKEAYGEDEEDAPYYVGYQMNSKGEFVGHRICVGIIDFLQRFRTRKKAEYGIRVIQTCATSSASVCPPHVYRNRFLEFMRLKLLPNNGSVRQSTISEAAEGGNENTTTSKLVAADDDDDDDDDDDADVVQV